MPKPPPPILLVDDDETVRDMIQKVLEHEGWSVVPAANGAAGLEGARDREYDFSLVIADLVMPVMSGREMVREMKLEHADVRFLIISGYDNFALQANPDTDALLWLEKPFKPQQLIDAVKVAMKLKAPSRPSRG